MNRFLKNPTTKKLLAAVLSVLVLPVSAQTYLQVNGASLHDRSGYNQFNYGLGIEKTMSKDWNMAAGWYRNSEYRGSAYAYGRYSFYQSGAVNLGVGVGIVTGYRRASVLPMAFPEACYGYVCALFVPKIENTGANVLGFHLKIPVN